MLRSHLECLIAAVMWIVLESGQLPAILSLLTMEMLRRTRGSSLFITPEHHSNAIIFFGLHGVQTIGKQRMPQDHGDLTLPCYRNSFVNWN